MSDAATNGRMAARARDERPAVRLPGGGRLAFVELFKRLGHEISAHALPGSAAQVAYYLFFSIFPFLFFLATLTAFLPLGAGTNEIVARVGDVLPPAASKLIHQHLEILRSHPRPSALTIALLGSLWSASRGVDAVRAALNRGYGVRDSRPWWKRQVLALGVTIVGTLMLLTAVSLLVLGGRAGEYVAHWIGLAREYQVIAHWARWPIACLVVMLVAAVGYTVLPDVNQKFKYISAGSVLGTLLWIGATWLFGWYVSRWGSYSLTYGTLGGVLILLTWFLIGAYAFLLGGEINAILEQASVDGKKKGERSDHPDR